LWGGACWTVRYNFSLVLVLFPLFLLVHRRDLHRRVWFMIGAFLLGAAIIVLPVKLWQLSVFATTQSPPSYWNLLDGLMDASPWLLYRTYSLADLFTGDRLSLLLLDKFPGQLELALRQLPELFHYLVIVPLFVAALFLTGENARQKSLLRFATVAFMAMAVVLALFRNEQWVFGDPLDLRVIHGRYLVWFAPILLGFGLAALNRLTADWRRPTRVGVFALVALLQLTAFTYYWRPTTKLYEDVRGSLTDLPSVQALADLDQRGEISARLPLVTNIPAQVAWYLDRPALGCPQTPEELDRILARHAIAGILFVKLSLGEPHNLPAWLATLLQEEPRKEFLARHGLRIVAADQAGLLLLPAPRMPGQP